MIVSAATAEPAPIRAPGPTGMPWRFAHWVDPDTS